MLIKIIIAIALGLLIGAEREKTGKVIGVRTTSLISLTTCLFCLMSPNVFNGDNSRIIAQIVSGLGFLGAGVIFKNEDGIHGLTTAATVFATGAIGCLVGIGMFEEAITGTIAIIIINIAFKYFKQDYNK